MPKIKLRFAYYKQKLKCQNRDTKSLCLIDKICLVFISPDQTNPNHRPTNLTSKLKRAIYTQK